MFSLVFGPSPKPMRRPTMFMVLKKCSANLRLTMATRGPVFGVVGPLGGLIGQREIAAGEHRHVHGLEVAGRQGVHERLHVLAVRGLVALDRHRAVPLVTGENRHRRRARRADAGNRLDPLEQLVLEIGAAGLVVAVQARVDLERDEVLGLADAGVGAAQVLQAAREEPGAEEEQETQRDLRGDQALAKDQRLIAAGDRPDGVLERLPRIGTAGAQRRQQAEDDAGDQRHEEGEGEDPQIGCRLDQQRAAFGRDEGEQRPGEEHRQGHADHATEERQDQALDQELADQLGP